MNFRTASAVRGEYGTSDLSIEMDTVAVDKVVAEVTRNATLRSLSMSSNDERGAPKTLVVLSFLRNNSTVEMVTMDGRMFTDSLGTELGALLKENDTIRALRANVDLSMLSARYVSSLAEGLAENTTLRILEFTVPAMGPAAAMALAECCKRNTGLDMLVIRVPNIDDAAIHMLVGALDVNTSLAHLVLASPDGRPIPCPELAMRLNDNNALTAWTAALSLGDLASDVRDGLVVWNGNVVHQDRAMHALCAAAVRRPAEPETLSMIRILRGDYGPGLPPLPPPASVPQPAMINSGALQRWTKVDYIACVEEVAPGLKETIADLFATSRVVEAAEEIVHDVMHAYCLLVDARNAEGSLLAADPENNDEEQHVFCTRAEALRTWADLGVTRLDVAMRSLPVLPETDLARDFVSPTVATVGHAMEILGQKRDEFSNWLDAVANRLAKVTDERVTAAKTLGATFVALGQAMQDSARQTADAEARVREASTALEDALRNERAAATTLPRLPRPRRDICAALVHVVRMIASDILQNASGLITRGNEAAP